ncbi:HtaA domain-containing protein [Nocardioides alcanivorans]|uniref:HtaA domain-containing protein n=1 Tax=Nocardioides alcanivorans TaxID=2897352 RepID=UPI001F1C0CBB|nr:HtaA domain-containing protein [Nocardioides alcanivorans]
MKASWRNYIGAGGTTLTGGVTRNEDGTFRFPVARGSYDDATRTTTVEFAGSVEFLGHCHGVPEAGQTLARPCDLDLTFSDVKVEISEDRASILVDAESRPIAGGDIVTYDDVALVDLDVEDALPTVVGGVTTWSDLTATMTADGERIFSYSAGTVVDPVTFSYDGPGGKPVGETWDVAGQAVHEATPATPQPGRNAQRIVGRLSTGELIGWGDSRVAVLDPQTLEPLSDWVAGPGVTGDILRDSIAIDPGTDTVFAATYTTNAADRRLVTYAWDGTTLTATEVADSHAPDLIHDSGSAGAWDPVGERYLVARSRSATSTDMWQVRDVDGTWTASRIGSVQISSPGSATWENSLVNMVAVPDGAGRTVLLATSLGGSRPVQRLAQVGDRFVGEPLEQVGDRQPDRVLGTRNGVYAVMSGDSALFIPYVGYSDNRRLGTATEPVPFKVNFDLNRNQSMLFADWASDTLVGVTDSSQNITRLERGVLVARGGLSDGPYGNNPVVGLTSDGDIWGILPDGLNVIRAVAQSPSFAKQPEAPVADLSGESAQITVSATVEGTPAPSVTWQSRLPGQAWTEVTDGAQGTTLTSTVTAADQGRQYRLIAENTGGRVASERVSLQLRTPPRIMVQPTDVAAAPGEDVQLKVMPDGSPAPTVQWQQRIGGVWHDVPGETSATLQLDDVDVSLSGTSFRARLTNPVGSVTSSRATVTVAEPSVERREITAGSIDWGVKASFRNYITGPIAHGSIEVSDGVSTNEDGTLAFPVVDGVWDPAGTSIIELGGSVRFFGHDSGNGPQLDLTISDPRVLVDGAGATLVADVVSRGLDSGTLTTYDDVVLADLDNGGDRIRALGDQILLSEVPAALTAVGAPAFADFYPAGSDLDPISGTVELGEVVDDTDTDAVATRTTVLAAGATGFGQPLNVRVRVSADDQSSVNGTVRLSVAGRTWNAKVVDSVAATKVPAGVTPGAYVLRAQFLGTEALSTSSGSDALRVTKGIPKVTAKLPKKKVRVAARAKLAVVTTLPIASVKVRGKVVVRAGGKVLLRTTLKPNAKGRTVLRLPRLAKGKHRLTVTTVANPRQRSVTSKAVVLRVR